MAIKAVNCCTEFKAANRTKVLYNLKSSLLLRMNAPLMILLFSLVCTIPLSSAVRPRGRCPNNWFNIQFVSIAENVVPASETIPSPDFSFFTDVLKLSQRQIEKVTTDAMEFFKDKYGVDFTNAEPNNLGVRETEDAILTPFRLSPKIEYQVTFNTFLLTGRRYSKCYENRDGGFAVSFKREQKLFGTYGGTEGKPIGINDAIVYGFYSIPLRIHRKPLVIRYTSGSPARLETNDGFLIINCDLFSRFLGHGTARGVSVFTPEGDGTVRTSIRNVFTFPAQPRQLSSFYYF